jgi:hypothetical protein
MMGNKCAKKNFDPIEAMKFALNLSLKADTLEYSLEESKLVQLIIVLGS